MGSIADGGVILTFPIRAELLNNSTPHQPTMRYHRKSLAKALQSVENIFPRLSEMHNLIHERSLQLTSDQGVNVIPPEILSSIFEFTAHDQPLKVAIHLSHICRSWRELAIGTPNLWTTIELQGSRQRVAMQLERSKWALLNVHIRRLNPTLSVDIYEPGQPYGSSALASAQSLRWRLFTSAVSSMTLPGVASS